MSKVVLSVQADNCSKEAKNNGVIRHLAMMFGNGRLRGAQMCFLSSGHGHEDIDAMFGTFRNWLSRYKEILTPAAFVDALDDFVPAHRADENFRKVMQMNKWRDWTLAFSLISVNQHPLDFLSVTLRSYH